MPCHLARLIELLSPERVGTDSFRGQSQDLGWGQVFGGQVLGQAVGAAARTVSPERLIHSLHAYFLRVGDVRQPIDYAVARIRDGNSFATRRIDAVQRGQLIFSMVASFQLPEESFDHADRMPEVRGPDGLKSDGERWRTMAEMLPRPIQGRAMAELPIEMRPVDPVDPLAPTPMGPEQAVWLRATSKLPDDAALHRSLLAYCSDFGFVTTALRPHGRTWFDPSILVASLDHAMWFHRPFRMDDWLLHVMRSPSLSGARALVHGSVFTRDGRLVASTAQEGLVRQKVAEERGRG